MLYIYSVYIVCISLFSLLYIIGELKTHTTCVYRIIY